MVCRGFYRKRARLVVVARFRWRASKGPAASRPTSPRGYTPGPVCCTREECTQEKLRRVDLPGQRERERERERETFSSLCVDERRFSRNFRRCCANARWSYEPCSLLAEWRRWLRILRSRRARETFYRCNLRWTHSIRYNYFVSRNFVFHSTPDRERVSMYKITHRLVSSNHSTDEISKARHSKVQGNVHFQNK